MIYGITLILLGLLAIPSLVLAKKPNAKELFDKIAPYQGWIGLVFAVWGVWGIISSILTIAWLSFGLWYIIFWLSILLGSILEAALGFILGYSLINKYVLSKNPSASEKGEQLLAKLLPWQVKLGLVAIALGVWIIISYVLVTVLVAVAVAVS
jgi:hypothetical protein